MEMLDLWRDKVCAHQQVLYLSATLTLTRIYYRMYPYGCVGVPLAIGERQIQ